jgi:hypothetical protein
MDARGWNKADDSADLKAHPAFRRPRVKQTLATPIDDTYVERAVTAVKSTGDSGSSINTVKLYCFAICHGASSILGTTQQPSAMQVNRAQPSS